MTAENKEDYGILKAKLPQEEKLNSDQEKNLLANIERFVTRIRMVAHQAIQFRMDLPADSDPQEMEFDPDSDGFHFPHSLAYKLHKNTSMVQFIRKTLGISLKENSKSKGFDSGLEELKLNLQEQRSKHKSILPADWECGKHDKALLKWILLKGFKSLNQIVEESTGIPECEGFESLRLESFFPSEDSEQKIREVLNSKSEGKNELVAEILEARVA